MSDVVTRWQQIRICASRMSKEQARCVIQAAEYYAGSLGPDMHIAALIAERAAEAPDPVAAGALGRVADQIGQSGVLVLAKCDSAKNFKLGMVVEASFELSGEPRRSGRARVVGADRDNGTVQVDGSIAALANGDYLFAAEES